MIVDKYNLNRFIEAQSGVYHIALKELQDGRKRSHWMWYIFPQLKGLGHSHNSNFYGISRTEEASEYLEHPILGSRLREVSNTILNLATCDVVEVFGGIDSLKLKSSMTLFDLVLPNDIFTLVLDKYFNGQRDRSTIVLLNRLCTDE